MGGGLPSDLHVVFLCLNNMKLDDGWPESEKGDCQAVPNKKIDKVQLLKGW